MVPSLCQPGAAVVPPATPLTRTCEQSGGLRDNRPAIKQTDMRGTIIESFILTNFIGLV